MIPVVETGTAAFLAGLVVSPHCGAMCAPLTCALGPWNGSPADRMAHAASYHLARTLAYAVAGALAGLLGRKFATLLDTPFASLAPWALVAWLLLLAVGVDRGLPLPKWVRDRQAAAVRAVQGMRPAAGGALLGGLSPLLPCGPLHALLGICLLTGSPAKGAELGMGFALGTLPLLWASQVGYHRLTLRFGTTAAIRWRRVLCAVAAILLAVKLTWFAPSTGVCL
ncbi:MAG: sulfite exporter TauE/SafE family protein [Opitutia bacterium]